MNNRPSTFAHTAGRIAGVFFVLALVIFVFLCLAKLTQVWFF